MDIFFCMPGLGTSCFVNQSYVHTHICWPFLFIYSSIPLIDGCVLHIVVIHFHFMIVTVTVAENV